MASSIVEIPVNSSLNSDTTKNNIQPIGEPQFTFNNAIYYQNALSSLYRHEMESSFISTSGKPLSYSDDGTGITTIIDQSTGNKIWSGSSIGVESTETYDNLDVSLLNGEVLTLDVLFDTIKVGDRIINATAKTAFFIRETNRICYVDNNNVLYVEKPDGTFVTVTNAQNWMNAVGDNSFLAVSVEGFTYVTQQGNKIGTNGSGNTYGTVWVINESNWSIASRNGQFIGLYRGIWTISHVPIYNTGGYGSATEWASMYNLTTRAYINTVAKAFRYPSGYSSVNARTLLNSIVGPGFCMYAVRYTCNNNLVGLFWIDQFQETGPRTIDCSIVNNNGAWESMFGTFNIDDNYSTQLSVFNFACSQKTNIRLLVNNGLAVAFSYRVNDADAGVLLAGFTTIDPDLPIDSSIDNGVQTVLYRDTEKKWNVIKLSSNVPYRVQKIADYLYKINTVDQLNVIVESTKFDVQPGSLDWNNRFWVTRSYTMPTISAYTWLVNSGWNLNYETTQFRSLGYFGPNSQFIFRGFFGQTTASASILYWTGSKINKGAIDVYFENVTDTQSTTPSYKYSISGVNNPSINSSLKDFSLPTVDVGSIMFSIPITGIFQKNSHVTSSVKVPSDFSATLLLYDNKTYEGYYLSNVVYNSKAFFNILGQNYTYNGQVITLLNQQNGVTINMTAICYALNFRFLGAGLYEAYFYNEFDHDFYVFSGDRQLVKALSLSGLGQITNSCFSSFDNQLFMFSDELIIIFRNGVLYCLDNSIDHFTDYYLTEVGCWLINATKAVMWSPNKFDRSYYTISIEPTKIELECLGKDARTNLQMSRWDFRLFSKERIKTSIDLITKTLSNNGILIKGPKKTITINPTDWDSGDNYSLSIVPQNVNGLGHGFELNSKDYIQVVNINADVTGAGNVGAKI